MEYNIANAKNSIDRNASLEKTITDLNVPRCSEVMN